MQHVNAFQNIEPFACSIFIAITAFGNDKVRYKQKIPIRRRFPLLSRDLLSCKYGCDRMQASSYVPNNSSFKVDAFHARILPQITPTVTEQSIRIALVNSDDKKTKVRAARAKVNSKHSKAFKKLAE